MSLRVIFMGTPDFSVPTLTEIIGQGHEVVSVYTRAPAPAGRGMELRPSPVQVTAERFGIPVFSPKTLKNAEAAEIMASHQADVAVVVAYGLILPKAILEVPELGCLNLHASLLPRWRGAAPIQRAIMAGDAETGVCVMKMEEGLDTGPVAMVETLAIDGNATAGEMHDRLAGLGADLMARALPALGRGGLRFTPQLEEGVAYASKIGNDEAKLSWNRPAQQVHDVVRGLSPFPGAYVEVDLGKGPERLKLLRTARAGGAAEPGTLLDDDGTVACAVGAVKLLQVQRAGKGPMSAQEFLRGARLSAGAKL